MGSVRTTSPAVSTPTYGCTWYCKENVAETLLCARKRGIRISNSFGEEEERVKEAHLNVLEISLNSYFCLPSCTSIRAWRDERTILSHTTTVLSGCKEA